MKFESLVDYIGNTPLVPLKNIQAEAKIFLKCEYLNPTGSIKDRMAYHIIKRAEEEGLLKKGMTIVENTSGNTGAAVALVSKLKGYKAIFTIPDKMSSEKINQLKAYGAEVIVCKTAVPPESEESYYSVAKRIAKDLGAYYIDQYNNPWNIEAYYKTLGPELWKETEGKIDVFIAGAGTGGTISGTGKFLKERNPKIKVIGVDAVGSVFTPYFKTGKLVEPKVYKLEGIGEDYLVRCMDFSVVDDFVQVEDRDGFLTARRLAKEEGIFAGGSSGAALYVALEVANRERGKNIVVILPDHGNRYLSKFYNDDWMVENGYL
ncbi:MAG: cysteine synthase family protein [Thermoanaerobaculia bacterium]